MGFCEGNVAVVCYNKLEFMATSNKKYTKPNPAKAPQTKESAERNALLPVDEKRTISILTLFPKMFKGVFDDSILKRAQSEKLVQIDVYDIRDWTDDRHKTADDEPYGGGVGMVMKPEPLFRAVTDIRDKYIKKFGDRKIIHSVLLTPQGTPYNYRITEKLAALDHLILICGHYEGVDHRVFDHLADERISIGDYILTGGEIPAMVLVDSVSRHVHGVLGDAQSKAEESFQYSPQGILKYPVYTRPEEFEGLRVPDVLLSGNHKEVERWRKEAAQKLTEEMRPDLFNKISGYF